MPRLVEHAHTLVSQIRAKGHFRHVTLDLAGYRRGSMNESAPQTIELVVP